MNEVSRKDEGIVHTNSKDWSYIRETVCMISTRCVVVWVEQASSTRGTLVGSLWFTSSYEEAGQLRSIWIRAERI